MFVVYNKDQSDMQLYKNNKPMQQMRLELKIEIKVFDVINPCP